MTKLRSTFDAVCFDCDSTLSHIEGIDELARWAGCEAAIVELTNAAMNGEVSLDVIYAARLNRVRPNRAALAWLADRYAESIVIGAKETISTLQRHGKAVYVVSGGLRPSVAAFAGMLGIDPSHVFAVDVYFDDTGAYLGFDPDSPLCRNNGKAIICRAIGERYGTVAMVGDGVTDLAARAGGAYVVGYGGVVFRDAMQKEADCYVTAKTLTATLEALLDDKERSRT